VLASPTPDRDGKSFLSWDGSKQTWLLLPEEGSVEQDEETGQNLAVHLRSHVRDDTQSDDGLDDHFFFCFLSCVLIISGFEKESTNINKSSNHDRPSYGLV